MEVTMKFTKFSLNLLLVTAFIFSSVARAENYKATEDQTIVIEEEVETGRKGSLGKPIGLSTMILSKDIINKCYSDTKNRPADMVGGFGTFPDSNDLLLTPKWKAIESNDEIKKLKDSLGSTLTNHFIYCLWNALK